MAPLTTVGRFILAPLVVVLLMFAYRATASCTRTYDDDTAGKMIGLLGLGDFCNKLKKMMKHKLTHSHYFPEGYSLGLSDDSTKVKLIHHVNADGNSEDGVFKNEPVVFQKALQCITLDGTSATATMILPEPAETPGTYKSIFIISTACADVKSAEEQIWEVPKITRVETKMPETMTVKVRELLLTTATDTESRSAIIGALAHGLLPHEKDESQSLGLLVHHGKLIAYNVSQNWAEVVTHSTEESKKPLTHVTLVTLESLRSATVTPKRTRTLRINLSRGETTGMLSAQSWIEVAPENKEESGLETEDESAVESEKELPLKDEKELPTNGDSDEKEELPNAGGEGESTSGVYADGDEHALADAIYAMIDEPEVFDLLMELFVKGMLRNGNGRSLYLRLTKNHLTTTTPHGSYQVTAISSRKLDHGGGTSIVIEGSKTGMAEVVLKKVEDNYANDMFQVWHDWSYEEGFELAEKLFDNIQQKTGEDEIVKIQKSFANSFAAKRGLFAASENEVQFSRSATGGFEVNMSEKEWAKDVSSLEVVFSSEWIVLYFSKEQDDFFGMKFNRNDMKLETLIVPPGREDRSTERTISNALGFAKLDGELQTSFMVGCMLEMFESEKEGSIHLALGEHNDEQYPSVVVTHKQHGSEVVTYVAVSGSAGKSDGLAYFDVTSTTENTTSRVSFKADGSKRLQFHKIPSSQD
eukprot:GHVS01025988.1.p1 GENE.GHVS01025988.1~~GHVS01025988.1.p1  ORF type:complete len:700 (+),score=74.43 GHVS01025988.1:192-2291(+)